MKCAGVWRGHWGLKWRFVRRGCDSGFGKSCCKACKEDVSSDANAYYKPVKIMK